MLEGYEPEIEAATLGILSETSSGVRSTYDNTFVNDHIRAGIPSIEAWLYLKTFLFDPLEITISRVN